MLTLAAALLLASSARAQTLSEAGAEAARITAEAPRSSCPDGREQYERRFQLYLRPAGNGPSQSVYFLYKSCYEHGERGQEGPGTVRTYEPKEGGWKLTLTLYEGNGYADVRLWRGEQYLGRLGAIRNEAAAANQFVRIDRVLGGDAELRGVPIEPVDRFPQLALCEEQFNRNYQPSRNAYLMMLTDEQAYYYYEDCDICAAVDWCDLKTGRFGTVRAAHSVSCSDIAPKGNVLIGCR